MKRPLISVFALVAALSTAAAAETSTFGAGIIIGEPTGIGIKLHLTSGNALAFGVAWSLDEENELHVQGDYLYHNYDLITVEEGEMPLYFGIGGRIKINEHKDDNVGIRFPVGLDYIFANYPFDIFLELVPILDLAPDTDFDLNGALGGRFWF
jgi:hypothetical protein